MLLLHLNRDEKEDYLYQQLYNQLKKLILKRGLSAHEKLPSKRNLAESLQISINTVINAYDQLLAEGYIYTVERKGYFVEEITHFSPEVKESVQLPPFLKESSEEEAYHHHRLSLSHMTADITHFPFSEWDYCRQQAIANHSWQLNHIHHPQGPYLVRETIAKLIRLSRGVRCVPEQIVLSTGTQPLLEQLVNIQHKDVEIAMENPGYRRVHALFSRMKVPVQLLSLDEQGIQVKELQDKRANMVFVTPSHQFPTGIIMPISRRFELLNWAESEEGRYIIEDDYDSEFKYRTDNIPSLQSLDRNQKVIYMGTFSKSLLPSLRISYMVLPFQLLEKYRSLYKDLIPYNNPKTLYTLHYFIKSGAYNRHINRMNKHYEKKRTLLIEHLEKKFKDAIVINDIPAGLHFTANFDTKRNYDEIEKRADEYELELYSMRRFLLDQEPSLSQGIELLLGFASIHEQTIEEAVERLYKIVM